MKTSLKIALLCAALAMMTACSAQKRAERRVRRAVMECPELVQLKAYVIDTTIAAPAFADCATFAMGDVATFDTLYAATPHGTVVVSLQPDSTLRVGFVGAPRYVHYQDTVRYAQVVVNPTTTVKPKGRFWNGVFLWLFGVGIGGTLAIYLLHRIRKKR